MKIIPSSNTHQSYKWWDTILANADLPIPYGPTIDTNLCFRIAIFTKYNYASLPIKLGTTAGSSLNIGSRLIF